MASKLSQITRYWQVWQKVTFEIWMHLTKILQQVMSAYRHAI